MAMPSLILTSKAFLQIGPLGRYKTIAIVLAFTFLTKPTNDTFTPYFQRWITGEVRKDRERERIEEINIFGVDSGWVGDAAANVVASITAKFSNPVITDYWLIKIATISSRGKKYYFLGAFTYWFNLGSDLRNFLDNLQST